jgi:hypothetical protein
LSSRRIKPEERARLRELALGDLDSAAGEHVLGLDGIAVIVHPNSPFERADVPTLRRIFTGELNDYAALGGPAGSTAANSKLSLERAQKIASELNERGVPAVDVEAMGSVLPVASNDSEDGRERNRRVEVWLR